MTGSLYFSYGSNMSRSRLVRRVGEVRVLGAAVLEGFEHRFDKKGSDGTAKGNIASARHVEVWGVAYQLDEEQLTVLDRFEGGYRRQQMRVSLQTGSSVAAISYTAVILDSSLVPTRSYLDHYVAGAREHAIPESYLRKILPSWYRY